MDNALWYCIIIFAAIDIFSIAIMQIFAVLLFLLFILKKFVSGYYHLIKNPLNIPLLIFIAGRLAAVFISTDFNLSYPSLYKEIVFYFLFFVFVNEIEITNKKRIKLLLQVIIASACAAALYGIAVYFFVSKGRITSTSSGYYTLGMFLAAVFSLSVMLGRQNEIYFTRIVWWIVNAILVTGILLTFDRIHWGVMTISVFIGGITRERKMLAVYILGVTAALLFVPSLNERIIMAVRDYNFSERDIIWKGAYMLMWKHPWFGFGANTFREIFPLYNSMADKGTSSWHNDFIQLYMEGGIIGLGTYLYLIVTIFVKGFKTLKNYKTERNIFYTDLTSALLVAILALVIGGFILEPVTTVLFILFISLLALLMNDTLSPKSTGIPASSIASNELKY